MSESFATNSVDSDRECEHRPPDKHCLIGLGRVIRVQHQDGTLQDSPGQVGRRCSGCLPSNQCDPSRDIAEEISARFRRKDSDPTLRRLASVLSGLAHEHILILSACSRRHRSQFREDRVG